VNNIGKDKNDRSIGEYWEDVFCDMARGFGWRAWPFQRVRGATFEFNGNRYVCPDVWILKKADKQYICEIKHKNLSRGHEYGFEEYRQISMLSIEAEYQNQFGGVAALYVVHNHDLAGGKYGRENNIMHWHAQLLKILAASARASMSKTLYNGNVTQEEVPIFYYAYRYFRPIEFFLNSDA